MVKMTTILHKWWSCLAACPKLWHCLASDQEDSSKSVVSWGGSKDWITGRWRKYWVKNTNSITRKLKLLQIFCCRCSDGIQTNEQPRNKCLRVPGSRWRQTITPKSAQRNRQIFKLKTTTTFSKRCQSSQTAHSKTVQTASWVSKTPLATTTCSLPGTRYLETVDWSAIWQKAATSTTLSATTK